MQGKSYRVLVIDDSELAREAIALELEGAGYDVRTLASPLGAITQIVQHSVDAVVVDLNMPLMSGPRFAEVLRANHRLAHVKLLLVTGEDRADLEGLGSQLGADAVLRKGDLGTLPRILRGLRLRPKRSSTRRRVLVVDDDSERRESLRDCFEKAGHDALAHHQARGALAAAVWHRAEVVLVASQLVDMPSSVVVELIREHHVTKQAAVFVIGPDEDKARFDALADGFLHPDSDIAAHVVALAGSHR